MTKHVLAALSSPLFTLAWWKAAGIRALRTAVTIAIPYVGASALFAGIPWLAVASAAGLGFVLSLATSLAGIPEASGKTVPVWLALLERTTKTLAQGLAVGIGNTVLFTDVHWSTALQSALIAALGSLLLGVLGFLPEADEPAPLAVLGEPQVLTTPSVTVVHTAIPAPADPAKPAAGTPPAVGAAPDAS